MLLLAVYALALWWGGTALVWLLVRRPRAGRLAPWLLPLVAGISLGVIHGAASLPAVSAGALASLLSFSSALVLWGTLETAHLLGWLTGPEKAFCPPQVNALSRFRRGLMVGLYHDLSILLAVALLWALLWQSANPTAAWAFTVLWLMRWSAKLNLFLGVANFDSGLMPERMRYMASYMQRRAMNPLFPVSLCLGVGAALYLGQIALGAEYTLAWRAGAALAATLVVLGVIEHLLMMLPIRDSQLWRWTAPEGAETRP